MIRLYLVYVTIYVVMVYYTLYYVSLYVVSLNVTLYVTPTPIVPSLKGKGTTIAVPVWGVNL